MISKTPGQHLVLPSEPATPNLLTLVTGQPSTLLSWVLLT